MDPYVKVSAFPSKFRCIRVLGEGAYGQVVAVRDQNLAANRALKCLLPECQRLPDLVEAFTSEARNMALLEHDNVVRVFEHDVYRGVPYIVMELLPTSLKAVLISRRGPLRKSECLHLLRQLCQGLETMHRQGRIHCDLKPSNLLLQRPDPALPGEEGSILKIGDFGLAKAIDDAARQVGVTLRQAGSPGYRSPERILNLESSPQTDIFALGIIAHEMLTGRRPFDEPSDPHRLPLEVPELEGFPSEVTAAIRKATARKPPDRHGSAMEFLYDLLVALGEPDDRQSGGRRPQQEAKCHACGEVWHTKVNVFRTGQVCAGCGRQICSVCWLTGRRYCRQHEQQHLSTPEPVPAAPLLAPRPAPSTAPDPVAKARAWEVFRNHVESSLRSVRSLTFPGGITISVPSGLTFDSAVYRAVGQACIAEIKEGWLTRTTKALVAAVLLGDGGLIRSGDSVEPHPELLSLMDGPEGLDFDKGLPALIAVLSPAPWPRSWQSVALSRGKHVFYLVHHAAGTAWNVLPADGPHAFLFDPETLEEKESRALALLEAELSKPSATPVALPALLQQPGLTEQHIRRAVCNSKGRFALLEDCGEVHVRRAGG